jgi:hypothetical protein
MHSNGELGTEDPFKRPLCSSAWLLLLHCHYTGIAFDKMAHKFLCSPSICQSKYGISFYIFFAVVYKKVTLGILVGITGIYIKVSVNV